MSWHYFIEFVPALVVVSLAWPFWSIIKSRTYIRRVLGNQAELEKFIKVLSSDNLRRDAAKGKPVFGSWLQNIDVNARAHFQALALARNALLVPVAGMMMVSFYFLGATCGVANLVFFFLMAIPQISGYAKDYNLGLVRSILLNLYCWYKDDPDEALGYCPKSFALALATVSQLVENGGQCAPMSPTIPLTEGEAIHDDNDEGKGPKWST